MTNARFRPFIEDLRTRLTVERQQVDRVADEAEDHLECAAAALAESGHEETAIDETVLNRFGAADDLARTVNEADRSFRVARRGILLRHLALAVMTSAAAAVIIIRAAGGGAWTRPVLLSIVAAAVILVHSVYAAFKPFSILNCTGGAVMVALGMFVLLCQALFARSIGIGGEWIPGGFGVLVIGQGVLSAITAYDHPLLD
ncbi:MAG: hypothetical protein ABI211_23060 [Vicinamibacterales bacterium]